MLPNASTLAEVAQASESWSHGELRRASEQGGT